jgi:hypothetical protein
MFNGIFAYLYRVFSIQHHIAYARSLPGWRVQGETCAPTPAPEVALVMLPEGTPCLWDLPGCACGMCLRDKPFGSRLGEWS